MIPRLIRSLFAALLLALAAGPAWAEVTLTFYAHPGARIRGGELLFPHAFVHAVGILDDTGEPVDWAAGFTAKNPGPQLLFARGSGVVLEPDPRYVGEGRPYLSLTVADAVYHAIRARADWWNGPEGSVYDLRRRNCITFIADLARLAGLQTAGEPSMKPGTFLEATAALNPAAAWTGAPARLAADGSPAPPVVAPPPPAAATGP
ncbi:MAG: hypothetical protein A2623_03310 [Caulobacterales bacterium RIFCSPHIGHO2_01_FULL_70_19]|nr:MAG: hypothetical protein A2623_03310 [Caulobacterales bacterium RIFCSPHIGHO2_01_FULL_70_19]